MIDKQAFRTQKRAEIRILPEAYIAASDAGIFQQLAALPEFQTAGRIFAYYSVGREADTQRILAQASALGKSIALPVVLGSGRMEYALFERPEQLCPGTLRIPEPSPDMPRVTPVPGDLLLVPGLCFDGEKYRMGQGGGYYDRYLPGCTAVTVGLARERLMPVRVPREVYDRPVDILITEARILR